MKSHCKLTRLEVLGLLVLWTSNMTIIAVLTIAFFLSSVFDWNVIQINLYHEREIELVVFLVLLCFNFWYFHKIWRICLEYLDRT